MSFLGAILFLILFLAFFVFLLGINILAGIVGGLREFWNMLTGGSSYSYDNNGSSDSTDGIYNRNNRSQNDTVSRGGSSDSGQVFADDEGTYVDFEEVKE